MNLKANENMANPFYKTNVGLNQGSRLLTIYESGGRSTRTIFFSPGMRL